MKFARHLLAASCATAYLLVPMPAAAQDFPSKPLRIVVPFSAGGIVDSIARVVGEKLSARYGQPVVIENRAGAGGAIGTDVVAKAPADGYTLLLASPSHAIAPSLQKGVTWNPVRDFRAIGGIGVMPNVIVVHADVPVKTMPELIELAKKSDTPLSYASAGIGTSNHLSGELLSQVAHVKLTHVPYKGQADAMNDLLSGRVTMMPLTTALAIPYIKAGKLRPLAVTTAKRSTAMPELPTVTEAAKLPDYDVGAWFGLVAPAKTPDSIARKLSTDLADIIAMPDVKTKLESMGMEYVPQNPVQLDAFVAKEFARWSKVIKQAGIEPN